MKSNFQLLVIFSILFLTSCSKEESTDNSINQDEILINARIDVATEDIQNLIENELDSTLKNTTELASQSSLPSCAKIERSPDYGATIADGTLVTKTIDFGTSCNLVNGSTIKGKIILKFYYTKNVTSQIVNYELVDFYHNDYRFNGKDNVYRSMSDSKLGTPHPIVIMDYNFNVLVSNATIYNRIGSRTREFIIGYETTTTSDDQWKIIGKWTTSFPGKSTQESVITTPLITKYGCKNITTGIVKTTRVSTNTTLDYGNGSCDNIAVLNSNGVTSNITL